jgi:hypothetical protein
MEILTALFVVLIFVWIGDRIQMKRRFENAKAHALEAQLLELQAYPYHCPHCAATLEPANSPTTEDLLKALIKYNEGAVWI